MGSKNGPALAHGEVTEQVARAVGVDATALDAIERGILNLRLFARWMIRNHEWPFTEESVVSALRRFRSDRQYGNTLERARTVLSKSLVNLHEGMCSLVLSNTKDVQQTLPKLFGRLDTTKGDRLRLVSSDQGFKLIINEAALSKVEDLFGKDSIIGVKRHLDELSIVFPPEARQTPGILAVISNALAAANVNLAETVDGVSQHIFLISATDSLSAYQVLRIVAGKQDQSRPGKPRRARAPPVGVSEPSARQGQS